MKTGVTMLKVSVALLFTVLSLSSAYAQCPSEPEITKVVLNNYFAKAAWPSNVVARGPRPFSADVKPEFYSSFDGFQSVIDNGPNYLWSFSQRNTDGCFEANWSSQDVPDAPFTPLCGVSVCENFCGDRAGEVALVEVYDVDENGNRASEAGIEVPCVWTSRGSRCTH